MVGLDDCLWLIATIDLCHHTLVAVIAVAGVLTMPSAQYRQAFLLNLGSWWTILLSEWESHRHSRSHCWRIHRLHATANSDITHGICTNFQHSTIIWFQTSNVRGRITSIASIFIGRCRDCTAEEAIVGLMRRLVLGSPYALKRSISPPFCASRCVSRASHCMWFDREQLNTRHRKLSDPSRTCLCLFWFALCFPLEWREIFARKGVKTTRMQEIDDSVIIEL